MTEDKFRDFLEELKQKCDIVTIISQYVPLTKKGSKYFGCCPFHNEKTGSFCVNGDGQYYHCFGCGVSGNVINFIMETESASFMEAVKLLADKVGLEVPTTERGARVELKKDRRDTLKQLMRDAALYYRSNLIKESEGKAAREYLCSRGIGEDISKRFGLGLSLGYDGIQGYMRRKGYSVADLTECGIVYGDKLTDCFANRIIVPIMNGMGEVIAFGGRIYRGEQDVAKYKNSTNTPLFDKSRTIYGINFIKKEKKQSGGFKELVLVEGYMDVISLAAAGIRNAVAGMGTALTAGQAAELRRLAPEVLVCYDGDAAGRKAAIKNVSALSAAGLDVRVVSLPDGCDPDDTVRREGAEGFAERLRQALPLTEYKLKLCAEAYDLKSVNGRAKYVAAALKALREVTGAAEKEVYLNEVSKVSGVSLSALTSQAAEGAAEPEQEAQAERAGRKLKAARFVLNRLLTNAAYADVALVQPQWLEIEAHKKILDFVSSRPKGGVVAGDLFDVIGSDSEIDAVLGEDTRFDSDAREKTWYSDCLAVLADSYISDRLEALNRSYDELSDSGEKRSVLGEIQTMQKKLKSKNIADKL